MTSRDLLYAAAKAAGIGPIVTYEAERNCLRIGTRSKYRLWRPISDGRDALELSVKMGISIEQDASIEIDTFTFNGVTEGEYMQGVEAWKVLPDATIVKAQEVYGGDPLSATSLAIVRVAAEVGNKL